MSRPPARGRVVEDAVDDDVAHDLTSQRTRAALFRAGSALVAPGSISTGSRQKGLLLAADWSTNPVYTSFALRATLATMGSYVFMTLTDWTEIHTCMITCVVTAFAIAEERERKQTLRLVGAILGGLYGLAAVVFFIPRFDSLMGLLIVLGVGTAMAAWLSTGPKRYSYAGWQMGLAQTGNLQIGKVCSRPQNSTPKCRPSTVAFTTRPVPLGRITY
ncbi:MAG: FUSC family protein [Terrimicrobiaceae bacterium]